MKQTDGSECNGRCLILPDLHQDAAFLKAVLAGEDLSTMDYVLFMGDFFDGRADLTKEARSIEQMLRRVHDLRREFGEDRVLALMGNHDHAYYRNWEFIRETAEFPRGSDMMRYVDEQISVVTAGMLIEPQDDEDPDGACWWGEADWDWLRPFVLMNGVLLSHAGVHPQFWPAVDDPLEALRLLESQWKEALAASRAGETSPLLGVGKARGGTQEVGGLLWCDWDVEFVDGLPFPQIVGHSADLQPRQKGRSWCLDCGQTCYGVLEAEGQLEVKRVRKRGRR